MLVKLMMATPTKHLSAFNVPHNILQINLLDFTRATTSEWHLVGLRLDQPPHTSFSSNHIEPAERFGRQQLITSSNSNVRDLLLWFYYKNQKKKEKKSLKASCQQEFYFAHKENYFLIHHIQMEIGYKKKTQTINNIDSYSY